MPSALTSNLTGPEAAIAGRLSVTYLHLQPELAHEPPPFLDFARNVGGIFVRRRRQRDTTSVFDTCLGLAVAHHRPQLLIEKHDNLVRCSSRRKQAILQYSLETRQSGFADGRQIRERTHSGQTGNTERA